MINIRLYNPIANKHNAWWYSWDGEDGVFSLDFVQKVFSDNPNETDFRFNVHCAGGEVEEGLAIYDWLRTSGKNIYMNIEGGCHSMAVTLLLAAPAENRSCTRMLLLSYTKCRAMQRDLQRLSALKPIICKFSKIGYLTSMQKEPEATGRRWRQL